MRPLIVGVLALWFVVVFLLGASGAIARPPGTPPFPILLGATVPVILFLIAYWAWPAFRANLLSFDLTLGTAIQAWRAGGVLFPGASRHVLWLRHPGCEPPRPPGLYFPDSL